MQKLFFPKNFGLLLFSLLLLAACGKDDESQVMSYPATYVSDKFYNTTPVRMYTVSGEVKDAALISAFVRKYLRGDFYYLQNKAIGSNSDEKITFLSAKDALIITGGDSTRYDVEKNGDDWVLTNKKEALIIYSEADENYINFIRAISKFKPLIYDKVYVPQQNGGSYVHKTKRQLIFTLSNKDAYSHQMVFTLKRGSKNIVSFIKTQNAANRFDISGLSQLRNTDTLLVQEFVGAGVKQ